MPEVYEAAITVGVDGLRGGSPEVKEGWELGNWRERHMKHRCGRIKAETGVTIRAHNSRSGTINIVMTCERADECECEKSHKDICAVKGCMFHNKEFREIPSAS